MICVSYFFASKTYWRTTKNTWCLSLNKILFFVSLQVKLEEQLGYLVYVSLSLSQNSIYHFFTSKTWTVEQTQSLGFYMSLIIICTSILTSYRTSLHVPSKIFSQRVPLPQGQLVSEIEQNYTAKQYSYVEPSHISYKLWDVKAEQSHEHK